MKAVRLGAYHQQPEVTDVPEPTLEGPLDVIVKIGGAGVCRGMLAARYADPGLAVAGSTTGATSNSGGLG